MSLEIVLDTNILLLATDSKFNLSSEIVRIVPQKHEIVVLSACLDELELLSNKPKLARQILFAKKLIETLNLVFYNPKDIKNTDDKIIQYAIENKDKCVVVTNDIGLRRILREHNLPIIFVRSKKHLELEGVLPR